MTYEQAQIKATECEKLNNRPFKVVPVTYMNNESGFDVTPDTCKEAILESLAAQQEIQMLNPPTSQAWQDASVEIHRLAELLTGKKPVDARG